jgi:hypothetical protein
VNRFARLSRHEDAALRILNWQDSIAADLSPAVRQLLVELRQRDLRTRGRDGRDAARPLHNTG